MELLNYEQMMKMPEGTIYQEYTPHFLSSILIFGGRLGELDYVEAELFPAATMADGPTRPLGVGVNDLLIQYPGGFGRNGMFDKSKHYVVWDEADRKLFAYWLLNPQEAVKRQNDDPVGLVIVPLEIIPHV